MEEGLNLTHTDSLTQVQPVQEKKKKKKKKKKRKNTQQLPA
jgi:hypothetical protein